jgi:hypothetical protein
MPAAAAGTTCKHCHLAAPRSVRGPLRRPLAPPLRVRRQIREVEGHKRLGPCRCGDHLPLRTVGLGVTSALVPTSYECGLRRLASRSQWQRPWATPWGGDGVRLGFASREAPRFDRRPRLAVDRSSAYCSRWRPSPRLSCSRAWPLAQCGLRGGAAGLAADRADACLRPRAEPRGGRLEPRQGRGARQARRRHRGS